ALLVRMLLLSYLYDLSERNGAGGQREHPHEVLLWLQGAHESECGDGAHYRRGAYSGECAGWEEVDRLGGEGFEARTTGESPDSRLPR
ncbi:MAG: hypothetical protein ACUVWZ_04570, partial [Anaerolineae bacterium]